MRPRCRASLLALLLVSPVLPAQANPDVWVTTAVTFEFADHRLSALTFVWRFDDYYSSRGILTYDTDRDGTLGPVEVERLRAESFDALSRFEYYVHLWVGAEKRGGLEVGRFTARIDGDTLVYEFSTPVRPPAGPGAPVTVSLFDEETVVDFRLAKSDFLLVKGSMEAGCKFRLARGTGAQSGHRQPVTLDCGG